MLFDLPNWHFSYWLFLFIGGIGCGFVNALAGGGSLITIPLLLSLGIQPIIANATNRLALVFQTSTAAIGYWNNGERDLTTVLWLAGPGLAGSLIGAHLAIYLNPETFRIIFAILLLLAVVPVFYKPKIFQEATLIQTKFSNRPSLSLLMSFFFVGVYSGFIQVGIGVWSLLLLLIFGSFSINHANAIKVQLLFLTTSLATILFLIHDQVILVVGVILAAGNSLGSWLATRLVRGRNPTWIRWLLLAGAIAACLQLLQVIQFK